MKKITLNVVTIVLMTMVNLTHAQVGIGTTMPNAQLDVRSSNQATPANNDGMIIPKVDVFPGTNPTAVQQAMLVYLTAATTFGGNPKAPGFYYWDNGTIDWIGISSAANGDHDWYEQGTTTAPNAITDNMFHTGNVAIGKNTASSALDVFSSGAATSGVSNVLNSTVTAGGTTIKTGINNSIQGNSNDVMTGQANTITSTGTGIHYGVNNEITSPNSSFIYGFNNAINSTSNTFGSNNNITNNSTSTLTTVNAYSNNLAGTSAGTIKGYNSTIAVSGNGSHYGNFNLLAGSGTGIKYGVRNELSGNGNQFGNYNVLTGSGTGIQYGTYNEITNSNVSAHTGILSTLSGTGAGLKTGLYSFISPAAGGVHYGIHSEVLKPGATNFAGYFLGNVGIGTTGANIYTFPPSRGLNGQVLQTNGTGVVTWQNPSSFAWTTTGNAGTNGGTTLAQGTNFIGTTDNQNIDFRTNNIYRGRFSSLGEFFVGTLNTVLAGDLMNAVGNATFPWACNGYSAFNGAGVYGQITSGTTIYAGVQGEYYGTNAQGAGVRGLAGSATAGTAFTAPHTGVSGDATSAGTYKFGTYGNGGTTTRSGGVLGNDYGIMGALGYYAFNGLDYSVYGFGLGYTAGLGTGRMSNNFSEKNTHVGLGIYGGVMGGWVRGMKYGFHTKGETYSLYVDGNGYTNKPLAYLIGSENQDKVASFMSTSLKPEVTVNGKVNLINGRAFVPFDNAFQQIISNIDDVIITASPQGKSNGVYIDNIAKNGFWIIENNDGVSNTKISWIAITKIKGEENPEIPSDLLARDFDKKMDGVMFNDNNKIDNPQSLWWDGSTIRWDKPTNEKVDKETEKLARPKKETK